VERIINSLLSEKGLVRKTCNTERKKGVGSLGKDLSQLGFPYHMHKDQGGPVEEI